MKYQALYRTYRPRIFDDVRGQDVIVRTLKNQVKTERIAHAYLFCGSRGTGKTTCAKILAQAVNCLHPVDGNPCGECESCRSIQEGSSMNVIEMDAASRNGVDDFRRIIDEIAYPPGEGKKKVYIIDEVHMLSQAAFNAFLKTLEEPPDYAVFILATTDPQKLLPTVLSRCQQYEFKRIPVSVIADRLREIFDKEEVAADDEAVRIIARRAEGGMRDALSIADRCVSFFPGERLTQSHILEVLGTADTSVWRSMLRYASDGDAASLIRQFDSLLMDGKDVRQIISDFTWYLRDLLIFKASGGSDETDSLLWEERETLLEDAARVSEQQIMFFIEVLSELAWSLHSSVNQRVISEIALINLCRPESKKDIPQSLEARIARIESQLESGVVPAGILAGSGTAAAPGAGDLREGAGGSGGEGALKQDARTPDSRQDLPNVVVPELFQRIAAQWKQTMGAIPNRGRGEVLAAFSSISFSKEEPDVLFIRLEDNWYHSLANDKALLRDVSDAVAAKYGVRPGIRFVNASQGGDSLTRISSRVEALRKEGSQFPIDVE